MLERIMTGPMAAADKLKRSAKYGKTANPAMALAAPTIMDNQEYCLIFRLTFLATAAGMIIIALVKRVPPTLMPKATTGGYQKQIY